MDKSSLIVGCKVIFRSVHGDFFINGWEAVIEEILILSTDAVFPQKTAYLIKFTNNNRLTWCRGDELTLVPC